MEIGDKLYRYYDYALDDERVSIDLQEFFVAKITPRGYWYVQGLQLIDIQFKSHWKWVSNHGRKRKCYDTKEDAWSSFEIRKIHQARHLTRQLRQSESVRQLIRSGRPDETNREAQQNHVDFATFVRNNRDDELTARASTAAIETYNNVADLF